MIDLPSNCPDCGTSLPADSPQHLCPSCLLKQAFASRTVAEPAKPQSPPPSAEEIADKFPQFEITECLGCGGMGVVYKARQKSLNRWVAIKVLAPERIDDEKFADFGIASLIGATGEHSGTPPYMAPEQGAHDLKQRWILQEHEIVDRLESMIITDSLRGASRSGEKGDGGPTNRNHRANPAGIREALTPIWRSLTSSPKSSLLARHRVRYSIGVAGRNSSAVSNPAGILGSAFLPSPLLTNGTNPKAGGRAEQREHALRRIPLRCGDPGQSQHPRGQLRSGRVIGRGRRQSNATQLPAVGHYCRSLRVAVFSTHRGILAPPSPILRCRIPP